MPEVRTKSAAAKVHARIFALAGSRQEDVRFAETLWDVVSRYVFISAYVRANRDSSEWLELACEMLSAEDYWPEGTDPDVLAFFEEAVAFEERRRRERERDAAEEGFEPNAGL
jgi:hypothetical protein